MAATSIAVTSVPRPYDAGVVLPAVSALNNVDGHEFRPTGKEYIKFACSADGSATIVSTDDPFGRVGDVAIPMVAGEEAVFGPIPTTGFADASTGYVNIKATGTITAVVFR